jgi:hypothetical protein
MTTTVKVSASGANYPARVVHVRRGEDERNQLIASGETETFNVGVGDTLTVTEEYHEAGYPAPQESAE